MRIDCSAKHHLVNVESDETKIFRLIEIHHLFEMFENKQLVLVSPKLWDDPYEDFLNHCYGFDPQKPNTRISYHGYAELLFGQCWTLNEDKDSTWRIYSPNKTKVKIQTTIKKLHSSVSERKEEMFISYIGKVAYHSESEIKENISTEIKNDKFHFAKIVPNFYFKKRDTFEDEKEIRLMVRLYKEVKCSNALFQDPNNYDICKLPFENALEIIEDVVFDPRTPNSLVRAYTNHLVNTFNFQGGCKKSTIYDSPALKIEVKNKFFQPSF